MKCRDYSKRGGVCTTLAIPKSHDPTGANPSSSTGHADGSTAAAAAQTGQLMDNPFAAMMSMMSTCASMMMQQQQQPLQRQKSGGIPLQFLQPGVQALGAAGADGVSSTGSAGGGDGSHVATWCDGVGDEDGDGDGGDQLLRRSL